MKTGCIILAGGKGRRLGREKAWVELEGSSFLQRAVSSLVFLKSEIIIVKAPEGELPPVSARVNLKVVEDQIGGKGPLAGIFTGLVNSKYRYNMVVACDMPMLNMELVKYMISIAQEYDTVVPRMGMHLEPLQALYSKDCTLKIEALLSQDRLKVDGLFGMVRTRFVEPAEIERFDPQHLSFTNINTPADFKKAGVLLGRS